MPGLLLLLVAQFLDGAHCTEHHLGRQLCVMRAVVFAAGIRVGVPIQARIRIGVCTRIGHIVVVEIATAAALMRHVARVFSWRIENSEFGIEIRESTIVRSMLENDNDVRSVSESESGCGSVIPIDLCMQ